MQNTQSAGRIKVLPAFLAQKIAAGEVIERPQSVVRELLDNAIDAGASTIELRIREGGIESIVVSDDGCGMSREDLELCAYAHATSKIGSEADLYEVRTLGFRGEALASMASVARLEIQSYDGKSGASLSVEGGTRTGIRPYEGKRGTRIEVRGLFFNVPARHGFLKRPSSEFSLCKATFLEKAIAHPSIAFRLFNNEKLAAFLPAHPGEKALAERFAEVYRETIVHDELVHQVQGSGNGFSVKILCGGPELFQHDRRMIQIYVNGRRIHEFALVQAIEYGYTGYLPGGRYPVAACFLEVEPSRVDVNIHPAKREVRLKDLQNIHSTIVRVVQDFLRMATQKSSLSPARDSGFQYDLDRVFAPRVSENPFPGSMQGEVPPRPSRQEAFGGIPLPIAASESHASDASSTASQAGRDFRGANGFVYLGQIFGVFLLVLRNEELILLDMHAAHERLLFDEYRQRTDRQRLLIPTIIETTDDSASDSIRDAVPDLERSGFEMVELNGGRWELRALPATFAGRIEDVAGILSEGRTHAESLDRYLFATMSCRAAIKDGDVISAGDAEDLIARALQLEEPRCPHGRPIFHKISKDDLYRLVGRLV